jgi:hypothetical protein
MKSHINRNFRRLFGNLPANIQQQAKDAFDLFQRNPRHPSLRFKTVHASEPVYSVRITRDYRAVGRLEGEDIIWYWIGKHDDYERITS